MNIYVTNISFKATDADLKELFQQHGEVTSAKIIIDKQTQRSRGFGFVEMPETASAQKAMTALNGFSFQGKDLTVNEARPKTDAPRGGGYNRGGYNN
jgi:RNA recognition motif-containing protein